MKRKIFMGLAIALTLLTISTDAKIRRVGYFANQIAGQDYATLQAAHDASASGDTLLIFPGAWSATLNRKVVLIGYGYFLSGTGSNSNLQVISGLQDLNITLAIGSDGCSFNGLGALQIGINENTPISNVVIKRCWLDYLYYRNSTYTNWQILQSYINDWRDGGYYYTAVYNNLLVQNCYIARMDLERSNYSGSTGVFNNCNFGTEYLNFRNGDYTISNCIFLGTTALVYISDCTFLNNIATSNIIPSGNGNKPNVIIANVCVDFPYTGTYSYDEAFKLKANSPAIGAGIDGVDCGMFGGADPYRLSGIPAIPSFYKLTSSSPITGANPYTITFSVRSNN